MTVDKKKASEAGWGVKCNRNRRKETNKGHFFWQFIVINKIVIDFKGGKIMRRFINSDLYIILWGLTSLFCWPVGIGLAVLGLVAGDRNGEIYI